MNMANNKLIIKSKIFTLCGTFLLTMMGSCTQNEVPEQKGTFEGGIVFTSPYTTSRSEAMRSGSFQAGDQVGILGYCKAENMDVDISSSPWDTKKPFCSPDVFYNQMLEYTSNGLWNYEWNETGNIGGLHPWIDERTDYTYAFFAYYPYVAITDRNNQGIIPYNNSTADNGMGIIKLSSKTSTGDPTITYTLPHNGSLISSKLQWDRVPDLMLAYKTNHVKPDGTVRLDFRHLFCAFEFKVNNYNEDPVRITNLRVSGEKFYKSVTVTGQESGYHMGDERYSGYFDILSTYGGDGFECPRGSIEKDENGNIIKVTPSTVTITTDGGVNDQGTPIDLLFIPNEHGKLTEDNNETLNLNITIDGIVRDKSMNLSEASFQSGVRSVFNINIVGNDIYLQMESLGNWDDDGDSDIVFE